MFMGIQWRVSTMWFKEITCSSFYLSRAFVFLLQNFCKLCAKGNKLCYIKIIRTRGDVLVFVCVLWAWVNPSYLFWFSLLWLMQGEISILYWHFEISLNIWDFGQNCLHVNSKFINLSHNKLSLEVQGPKTWNPGS